MTTGPRHRSPGPGLREVCGRCRRAALRRIQDQGRPAVALLFNAGLFDDGAKLGRLAEFYARRLLASGLQFDMLFGPAYKGITLAAAVAIELARLGRNVPAYNRKEAKDHGEGGTLVGAKVAGPRSHRR